MPDPGDRLYDPRLFAPEPGSPCPECGNERGVFHLFVCPIHEAAEETYHETEEIDCFVCGLPKPFHTIGCWRGADFGPQSRKTTQDFIDDDPFGRKEIW